MAEGTITKRQWKGFTAAWLGWAFDGLDGYLYVLVATKFVGQLMGLPATDPSVAWHAGLIQGIFLIGWAIGGAVFGRIGDKLGRAKTLSLTIFIYAVFTGMAFFSQAWWHLLIFRFLAALGIGGEWAAGSALVSETLHAKHRSWASALLQSGYMFGMMGAAITTRGFAHMDARYVFIVGVLPALATFWIRRAVPEPEEWSGAHEREKMPRISALFAGGLAKKTLLTLTLTSIALTTVWAFLYFAPQIVKLTPEVKALDPSGQADVVFQVTMIYIVFNIIGNFCGTYLARLAGYRVSFTTFIVGAFVSFYFGFNGPKDLATTSAWIYAAAFFSLGVFGMFPLYIPPLFPTLLRTTGAGFCYNFGRVIAGVGAICGGVIAGKTGGPLKAVWLTSFLYLFAIVIALLMPEPKFESD